jgi:Zn-dependent protease
MNLLNFFKFLNYNFSICGTTTTITIHYTFFLLLFLTIFTSLKSFNLFYIAFVILEYGPILFVTVFIHELGHLAASKLLRGNTSRNTRNTGNNVNDNTGSIVLWPLGGFTSYEGYCNETGPLGDLMISLAGPITHIPQCMLWFGLYCLIDNSDNYDDIDNNDDYVTKSKTIYQWFQHAIFSNHTNQLHFQTFIPNLCAEAVRLNVLLMTFNMLPLYPLDGSQIFVSILQLCCTKRLDPGKMGIFVGMAGMIFSLLGVVGVIGGFIMIRSTFNILIFTWCFYQNWNLFRLARDERVDEHPLFRSSFGLADSNGFNDDYEQSEYGERPWTRLAASDEIITVMDNGNSGIQAGEPWWNFWKRRNNDNDHAAINLMENSLSTNKDAHLLLGSHTGNNLPVVGVEEDYGF